MKRNEIYKGTSGLILYFSFLFFTHAQDIIAPEIEFSGMGVDWVHTTKDTNFIYSGFGSATQFSNRLPIWSQLYEQDLYIMEQHLGPGEISGFSLFKINQYSGEEIWALHDNFNTGVEYNEIFMSKLFKFQGDSLRLFGYQSNDKIPTGFSIAYNGNPMIKTIDLKEVSVRSQEVGTDSLDYLTDHRLFGLAFGRQIINSSEDYLHTVARGRIIDSIAYNVIDIYKIDESLNIDSTSRESILWNTEIMTLSTNLIFAPYYQFISDSILYMANYALKLPETDQSPSKASIGWYNISSLENINLIKEYDVTDYYFKASSGNMAHHVLGNDAVLFNHIDELIQDGSDTYQQYSSITWFHMDDGLINFIPVFGNTEKNYLRLNFLGIEDDILMFCALFENEMSTGFDFYTLDREQDATPQYVGNISIENDIDLGIINYYLKLTEEKLFFSFNFKFMYGENEYSDAKAYLSLDLSKLTSTSEEIQTELKPDINFYPNPTHDFLSINFQKLFNGEVTIRTLNNKAISNTAVLNSSHASIDVSHLSPGGYIISVQDFDNNLNYSNLVFKQ